VLKSEVSGGMTSFWAIILDKKIIEGSTIVSTTTSVPETSIKEMVEY